MDISRMLESLDSLWFFGSVLCGSGAEEEGMPAEEQPMTKDEENAKPTSPNHEKSQKESRPVDTPVPKCQNCGGFSDEGRAGAAEEVAEAKQSAENKRRITKRVRKRRKTPAMHNNDIFYPQSWLSPETGHASRRLWGEAQVIYVLPPVKDDLAMKEHIRTWAHAVACSVR